MATKNIISDDIKLLLHQKGNTCISIILPLHIMAIDQKADKIRLAKTVKGVCDQLKNDTSEKLITSLNSLTEQILFNRNDQGIGLYVSEAVAFYSTFPFAVAEIISVDKRFRLKEMLQKEQYAVPYAILNIDEHEIRLFTGILREVNEIRNGEFPMIYEDTYDYQPAACTTPRAGYAHVKSFEKEIFYIEKIRHEAFIREADDRLRNYLQNSEVLLLCGVRRHTSVFLNRTIHANKIIGVLNGNFNRCDEAEFTAMAWPYVEAYIYEKIVDEVSEFTDKIGEGLAEEGIVPVWEAIVSGRGETLLIEKNYQKKGFLTSSDSWELLLQAPKRKYYTLEDAVNNLLEIFLEKNGKVVLTEGGMLNEHQHIALITRYRYFS